MFGCIRDYVGCIRSSQKPRFAGADGDDDTVFGRFLNHLFLGAILIDLLPFNRSLRPHLPLSTRLVQKVTGCHHPIEQMHGLTLIDRSISLRPWPQRKPFYLSPKHSINHVEMRGSLPLSTFHAEKLQTSLDHLIKACIEEQLFPRSAPKNVEMSPRRKRSADEMTPASLSMMSLSQDYMLPPPPPLDTPPQLSSCPSHLSSEVISIADVKVNSPPMLQLFNLPAPKLDACLFQFPGTGPDPEQGFNTLFDGADQPFDFDIQVASASASNPLVTGVDHLIQGFQGPSTPWFDHHFLFDGFT